MNTYTHILFHAAASKKARLSPLKLKSFVLGAFLPDLPFLSLTLFTFFSQVFIFKSSSQETFFNVFRNWFFTDPLWISSYSLFHSPLMLVVYWLIITYSPLNPKLKTFLRYTLAGVIVHSALDIFTHYNDGPLLFWPLNWQLRFPSPISYWDPRHHGHTIARTEHLANFFLIFYLLKPRLNHLLSKLKPTSRH